MHEKFWPPSLIVMERRVYTAFLTLILERLDMQIISSEVFLYFLFFIVYVSFYHVMYRTPFLLL